MRRGRHEAVLGQRHAFERHHRRRERSDAAGHLDVALTAAVNQLHEDAAALGMDGVGDRFPAFHLAVVIEAGGAQIGARGDRDADAFDDLQTAFEARWP